ncbi:MAG: helix-turn-helix transcriptional regulator [Clostridia bacterium]|nr:helix-turn-helix transcriptional regulator [Clostridia bacterium]
MSEYHFGALNSDEEYNSHYLTYTDENRNLSRKEQLAAMAQLLDSLPSTFHEALERLMRMKQITIEQLENRALLSTRTISRLRSDERREYSLDQVIAICVALRLPPWLSDEMLVRAGFTLRKIPLHRAYRFILDCMFMDNIEDVQKFLTSSGHPPLNLKASA